MSPLSVSLREATSAAHEGAERTTFVQELLEGRACAGAFTELMVQQVVIYEAMESILADNYRDHPMLRAVDDRALDRTDSLRTDLETLLGTNADSNAATGSAHVVPATLAYARRLREGHCAEMMLAHHYVRYLGDLSGGQVIARLVNRHYGVPEEALHFYRFPEIPKLKPYKDRYRAALDTIELNEVSQRRVLDYAVEAFEMSAAIFAALDASRDPRHAELGVVA